MSTKRNSSLMSLAKHAWPIAFFFDLSLVRRHLKYLKFLLLRWWIFLDAIFLLSKVSGRHALLPALIITICLVDFIAFARLRIVAKKNALALLFLSCTTTLLFFLI